MKGSFMLYASHPKSKPRDTSKDHSLVHLMGAFDQAIHGGNFIEKQEKQGEWN